MSKMLVRLNNTDSAGFGLYTAMKSKVSLSDCVNICKVVEETPNEMPMGMKYSDFQKYSHKKAIYRAVIQAIIMAVDHWLNNDGCWAKNETPDESE